MKIYIKTFIIFIATFIPAVILRHYCRPFASESSLKIIFMSFLGIAFALYIFCIGKSKWKLFTPIKWQTHYWYLIFVLIIMFGIVNAVQVEHSGSQYFAQAIKPALIGYSISTIISSISEEIIYRGFIQSFINENTGSSSSIISKGNIFATGLFFISHIGFFTVMDPVFAVMALVNVIAFSLIVGYLFDKTKNISVPVIIHIAINMLHILIQNG